MPDTAYFRALGDDRYQPTEAASGAWNPGEIHFSALGGLLTHAIERDAAARDSRLQLGRMTFDILGVPALDEIAIATTVVRPGRTIELVEATATIGARTAAIARAWRMLVGDTAGIAGGEAPPLPTPADARPWTMAEEWGGGFVRSVESRAIGTPEPGRATVWIGERLALVDREDASEAARFIGRVDLANGIAVRASPDACTFPNVDLTIHLHRAPRGPWTGLDTTVSFGPTGLGITSTALHDEHGHVGFAAQSLTVRPR